MGPQHACAIMSDFTILSTEIEKYGIREEEREERAERERERESVCCRRVSKTLIRDADE